MYIRLKKRKLTGRGSNVAYDAVLVESYRNEEGKSRQRYVQHLITIQDRFIKLPHTLRRFYDDMAEKLAAFGIEDNQAKKMISRVEAKLGTKPTEAEAEAYLREAWQKFYEM